MTRLSYLVSFASFTLLAIAGCKDKAPDAKADPASSSSAAPGAPVFAIKPVASESCKVGSDCTATFRIEAVAPYHVNKEYPHKFIANDLADVQFLGAEPQGRTFSKAAFVTDGEKVGTMAIKFKAMNAGKATISGTYSFSVCTPENCRIDTSPVTLTVSVL